MLSSSFNTTHRHYDDTASWWDRRAAHGQLKAAAEAYLDVEGSC